MFLCFVGVLSFPTEQRKGHTQTHAERHERLVWLGHFFASVCCVCVSACECVCVREIEIECECLCVHMWLTWGYSEEEVS